MLIDLDYIIKYNKIIYKYIIVSILLIYYGKEE